MPGLVNTRARAHARCGECYEGLRPHDAQPSDGLRAGDAARACWRGCVAAGLHLFAANVYKRVVAVSLALVLCSCTPTS